jgi:hypothetical protein
MQNRWQSREEIILENLRKKPRYKNICSKPLKITTRKARKFDLKD